jgi:lipopolysaccharide export system protein LptA
VAILQFNYIKWRIIAVLLAASVINAAPILSFARAEEKPNYADKNLEKGPIHITADKLITDNKTRIAEFIGNVRVTQGDTIITSEGLLIYNKKGADQKKDIVITEGSIEKIVANGHVKITFGDKIATAQKAEYFTDSGILVLSGPDSKVTSGDDSISGSKITLHRPDGRIEVEGSKERRVEAVIYSEGKAIENSLPQETGSMDRIR